MLELISSLILLCLSLEKLGAKIICLHFLPTSFSSAYDLNGLKRDYLNTCLTESDLRVLQFPIVLCVRVFGCGGFVLFITFCFTLEASLCCEKSFPLIPKGRVEGVLTLTG